MNYLFKLATIGIAAAMSFSVHAGPCTNGAPTCGFPATQTLWYYQCQFGDSGKLVGELSVAEFRWNYIGKIKFEGASLANPDLPFKQVEDNETTKRFGKTQVPKISGNCSAFADYRQYICQEAVIEGSHVPCSEKMIGKIVKYMASETAAN